jgi:malonyl-CoA O-methyltransferase
MDMAIGMLHVARGQSGWWRKLFGSSRQAYVCADVEALPLAANSMELVWSNLALQWCNDLAATFRQLHGVLQLNGLLLFSTFGPDTLKELRSAFQGVDGHSHVNRFIDMHDIGDMLVAAGFADPVMEMETLTLTYSDVRAVMEDLRGIGAHNVTAGRSQGLMGKAAWKAVTENYERLRRDGKLPATFEIIYGHAWKPAPKAAADGRAIIQTPFKL